MIVTLFSDGSGSTWTPPSGTTEEYDTAAAQSSWVSVEGNYTTQFLADSTGQKTAVPQYNSTATAEIIALAPAVSTAGTNELQPLVPGVQVFPNPNQGTFTINNLPGTISNWSLYNVFGEKVYSDKIVNCKSFVVHLDLPDGIYFLVVENKNGKQVEKVIVN